MANTRSVPLGETTPQKLLVSSVSITSYGVSKKYTVAHHKKLQIQKNVLGETTLEES
jgi:hypothetical protein